MDVVIHMLLKEDRTLSYEIICPADTDVCDDSHLVSSVLAPFCDEVVSFVDAFSKYIFNNQSLKKYPELMALAFWMRRGHIGKLRKEFKEQYNEKILLGRGIVFHIAPANVDTLFVYSWFLSLLVGNINIIRLSSKTNKQLSLLLDVLNSLLEQECFKKIRQRTLLIRYGHDDAVTSYFSRTCDVRVIWGGDRTIQHIRSISIPPTSVEIPFADKFSLAVINAENFNKCSEQPKIVDKFYNDAFWFGQMACSSPRLVVWIGDADSICNAQQSFWNLLEMKTQTAVPELTAADVMNKVVISCMVAIEHSQVKILHDQQGFIHRVQINTLNDIDEQQHCGAGLFFESSLERLTDLSTYFTKRNQTVTYFGFERTDWNNLITLHRPSGIDRIVPIGQALDFSVVWDGLDLLRAFCREISIDA